MRERAEKSTGTTHERTTPVFEAGNAAHSHHVVLILGVAVHLLDGHHARMQRVHELARDRAVGRVFNAREARAYGLINPAQQLTAPHAVCP